MPEVLAQLSLDLATHQLFHLLGQRPGRAYQAEFQRGLNETCIGSHPNLQRGNSHTFPASFEFPDIFWQSPFQNGIRFFLLTVVSRKNVISSCYATFTCRVILGMHVGPLSLGRVLGN